MRLFWIHLRVFRKLGCLVQDYVSNQEWHKLTTTSKGRVKQGEESHSQGENKASVVDRFSSDLKFHPLTCFHSPRQVLLVSRGAECVYHRHLIRIAMEWCFRS